MYKNALVRLGERRKHVRSCESCLMWLNESYQMWLVASHVSSAMEGTRTRPDYLVNRADQQNWGAIQDKNLHKNREIAVVWGVRVDSWRKWAHSWDQIQTLKVCLFCHMYCAHRCIRLYRTVTASCAVSNREFRYPASMCERVATSYMWHDSMTHESCHTWLSHVTRERITSRFTCDRVVPGSCETFHIWLSHVTRDWLMSLRTNNGRGEHTGGCESRDSVARAGPDS